MRKTNFLGRAAANAQRQSTRNATKAVYTAMWGTTPESDRRKKRGE